MSYQCVLVGDGIVGRTNKINSSFSCGEWKKYVEFIMKIGEKLVTYAVTDIAGQEDYDRIRPLSYPNSNVFLVCFSVANRGTFENVEARWVPEITHYCKGTPFLLVETKIDLRDDLTFMEKLALNKLEPVTFEQGQKMAEKLNAVKYVECSALTQEGLDKVFDTAIRFAREPPLIKDNRKCCLL